MNCTIHFLVFIINSYKARLLKFLKIRVLFGALVSYRDDIKCSKHA